MDNIKEILCSNSPCEAEAMFKYVTDSEVEFYLCHSCKDAFELGQVNHGKGIFDADETLSGTEIRFEAHHNCEGS